MASSFVSVQAINQLACKVINATKQVKESFSGKFTPRSDKSDKYSFNISDSHKLKIKTEEHVTGIFRMDADGSLNLAINESRMIKLDGSGTCPLIY